MNMSTMMQFLRQIPEKLRTNSYSSLANQNAPRNVAFVRHLQKEMKKQDVLEVPFTNLNVVVFDIETTGFYPYNGDRILSIGAVKVQKGKVIEEDHFYSLIYNENAPSHQIQALTGILEKELVKAPPIDRVLNDFFQFVKSDPLIAHHANHERSFMQHVTWSVLKSRFEHRVIDTSFLTKINEEKLNLITLDDWCYHYGIRIEKRHHALHDAIATANLWVESVRLIEQKGFYCLKDVYSYLAAQR